jgi:biopolymer transport protein ExbD
MRLRDSLVIILMVACWGAEAAPAAGKPSVEAVNKVAIGDDGKVQWNGMPVDDGQLAILFREIAKRQPQPSIRISGSKEVRFEIVGKVISLAQSCGVTLNIGFITGPAR